MQRNPTTRCALSLRTSILITALAAITLTGCGSDSSGSSDSQVSASEQSSAQESGPDDALDLLTGCSFEPTPDGDKSDDEGVTVFTGTNDSGERLDTTSILYTLMTEDGDQQQSLVLSQWEDGQELAYENRAYAGTGLGTVTGCEITSAEVRSNPPVKDLKDDSTTCSIEPAQFGSLVDVVWDVGDAAADEELLLTVGIYEGDALVRSTPVSVPAGESTGAVGGGDNPDATCRVIELSVV